MSDNKLVPFAFDDNLVRGFLDENGDPWFVAKDVAVILELQNIRQNLAELDVDEKGVCITDTLGGPQQVTTVSESGLYTLVFKSRKPEAKRFRKWVTSEVLPTLRKTGRYAMPGMGGVDDELADAYGLTPQGKRLPVRQKVQLMSIAGQIAKGEDRLAEVKFIYADLCNTVAEGSVGWAEARRARGEESARRFAAECLTPAGPKQRTVLTAIYAAYVTWCSLSGEQWEPVAQLRLANLLTQLLPDIHLQRLRNPSGRHYVVCGWTLKRHPGHTKPEDTTFDVEAEPAAEAAKKRGRPKKSGQTKKKLNKKGKPGA
jgi:prophage antirepressor-like protein